MASIKTEMVSPNPGEVWTRIYYVTDDGKQRDLMIKHPFATKDLKACLHLIIMSIEDPLPEQK